MRVGLLPLGRPTFDVPFAEERLAAMLARLQETGAELTGPRALLFDAKAASEALATLAAQSPDVILLLQATFCDASMAVETATAFPDTPLAIWAVPEPRTGGRLRLNSLCGLNLASHALGLSQRPFGWLFADPDGDVAADLAALLAGDRAAPRLDAAAPAEAVVGDEGEAVAAALRGRRIGRIGEHPEGFHTCAYDPSTLKALAGLEVEALTLDDLFARARAADPPEACAAEAAELEGIGEVDGAQLDRSLRLRTALDELRAERRYDAFAIRCWPEAFTEYGGAVCGPVSMLGEARAPCACEADVYGAATQLLLQAAAEAPVFLADVVDMDVEDDTGVVWHCGQAPVSMASTQAPPRAAIHSNRRMPLLYEFALKPGRVTFARLSQALGAPKLVLGGGEMLERPLAFGGTAGVLRFDRPVARVLPDLIASGLEHHVALAYGDHRQALRGAAAHLGLGVLEL
ncbi:MAG: hypothetical protein AAFU61_10340 [Pseudomonadota bacterium]